MRRLISENDSLSKEAVLIFSCARVELDAQTRFQINRLIVQPIDWKKVIEKAVLHGVAPLLYYNLTKINVDKKFISQEFISELKEYYYRTVANNLRFWKELQKILNIANQTEIKVIPIKGIIFADTLYHNIGLRMMTDIDLLIQEENLLSFEKILNRLDYKKKIGWRSEDYLKKYYHHFVFKKDNSIYSDLLLEVHWDLSLPRPTKIFFAKLWERVEERMIDGTKIFMLSPEDTLFCLVLHLRRHTRSLILRQISDISELIGQYKNIFDWDYVINEAEKNRIKSVLYFALFSARELLNTSIPENILDRVRPVPFKCTLMHSFIDKDKFFQKKVSRKELFKIKYFILRFLLFDRPKDFLLYILLSPIEEFIYFYLRNLSFAKFK